MSDIPDVYVANYSSSSELWKEMTTMLPIKFIQDNAELTAQRTFKIGAST